MSPFKFFALKPNLRHYIEGRSITVLLSGEGQSPDVPGVTQTVVLTPDPCPRTGCPPPKLTDVDRGGAVQA